MSFSLPEGVAAEARRPEAYCTGGTWLPGGDYLYEVRLRRLHDLRGDPGPYLEDLKEALLFAHPQVIEALAAVNTRLEAEYGVRLALRVGIHSGPVAGGEGGDDQSGRPAYGDTPTIAIMLQGLAEPNTLLLSAATARMVRKAFVLEDLGTCTIKGIAKSVAVFHVLGRRQTSGDEETTT